MSRFSAMWAWITVGLGVAVVVSTFVESAMLGVWFDNHPLLDGPSSDPEFILGFIGCVLIVGGAVAAPSRRPKPRS